MQRVLSNDYFTLICRIIFGGLFIYASLDKIAQPSEFARIVNNYHILPGSLVNLFALILPFTELFAGIFLILGFMYQGSRDYLVFMVIIFMIAIGVNVVRGVNLECGCFTVSSKAKSSSLWLVLRDFIYMIPGILLMFSKSRRFMLDNFFAGSRTPNPQVSAE